MKPTGSLKSRLLLGSFLWTVGLLAVTNILITGLAFHAFPGRLIHLAAMGVAAFGFLVGGLAHIRSILAPFKQLQARLNALREGREERLEGGYPLELQPLVADLNALLDHRALLVQRAVAKAGDLAHGLKTPLAVIGHEADRLSAAGHLETATIVSQQVERMRRQMDYHLAHARAAASGAPLGTSSSVKECVEGLFRTLARLHAEKGIVFESKVPESHRVRVQREDLDEMLGNLLDNACKWGKSRVRVDSSETEKGITLRVDDDGPGIAPAMRGRVLQRGVRADEAAPGSGFGLAIVGDLAELYEGSVVLDASPEGGARVLLTLPSSAASVPRGVLRE